MPVTQAQLTEQLIEQRPDTQLIYLFGSMATDCMTADSDVDIALLTKEPLDNLQRWELAQQLAESFGRDVDLVDLKQCSTVLRMQIITEGKLLFDRANYAGAFETTTYSMYLRLQESRQAILRDFVQELTNG